MVSCVGFFLFFISIWIVIVAQSSFPDLVFNECRIKGIILVTPKALKYSFNFTTAETVCLQLGLTLAYKVHMEEARKHGFETCSYGWVADGISVISRIQPNEKCGQSRTGVVEWSTPRSKPFHAYCFNSSDTWINSCKPDPIPISTTGIAESSTAFQPETATARPTATVKPTVTATKTSVKPGNEPQINVTNIPSPSTRAACLTTLIIKPTSPSSFLEKLTTTESKEETSAAPQNKGALKSDHVIFGGLPTALLVLALFFFAAAVTLAVCYVRKYKATLPISNKTQQKENVEVKVFKETKTDKKSSDGEQKQNGQPTENPPSNSESKPAEPEKSAEAEV